MGEPRLAAVDLEREPAALPMGAPVALEVGERGPDARGVQDGVRDRAEGPEVVRLPEVQAERVVAELVGGRVEEDEQPLGGEHAIGIGEIGEAQAGGGEHALRAAAAGGDGVEESRRGSGAHAGRRHGRVSDFRPVLSRPD